jgi:hypothetical protein
MEESGKYEKSQIWKKDVNEIERIKLKRIALATLNNLLDQKKLLFERLINTKDDQEKKDITKELEDVDKKIDLEEKIIKDKSESN